MNCGRAPRTDGQIVVTSAVTVAAGGDAATLGGLNAPVGPACELTSQPGTLTSSGLGFLGLAPYARKRRRALRVEG